MMKHVISAALLALALGPLAGLAQSTGAALPPAITADASVERILHAYPLGVVTMQAALSEHGAPSRKLKRATGQEWWVYDVGAGRTYTLVFDRQGIVAD